MSLIYSLVTLLSRGCDVLTQMLHFHGSEHLMEIAVMFHLNIPYCFFCLGQTLGNLWKI